MKQTIVGRKNEINRLQAYIASENSEFVVVYGRRRVGKTFLVKELLSTKFAFRITGKENATMREQLANFRFALNEFGQDVSTPQSWQEAFRMLASYLEGLADGPKIIFIDELPWFDTKGAKFVSELEHFWNDWAYYRNDVKLIVCGSATSWMLSKVINSRGGLHNRVTHKILVSPFSLGEVEEYFKLKNFNYERTEIIESYMAIGGVAYYLSLFEKGKSVTQNIDSLCFARGGELVDEFNRLFRSLFKNADNYLSVIEALQKKGKGLTRLEIIESTKKTNNGNLSSILRELEECEFIRSYSPFGKSRKEKLYQLIDPFTLFYFHFMKGHKNELSGYWQKMQVTNRYESWCGYAFEIVCLHHLDKIVKALGVDGTINQPCSWIYRPTKAMIESAEVDDDLKQGAQIDLLIDRSDKTVSVCEIKYSHSEYEITKRYDALLQQRLRIFKNVTKTKKTIMPVFITPMGLVNNVFSRRLGREIEGNDLF